MKSALNPFEAGPGKVPPYLAGRENIIEKYEVYIERITLGRSWDPTILFGLRGVGKTVLLIEIEKLALKSNFVTDRFEVDETNEYNFKKVILNRLKTLVLKIDTFENLKKSIGNQVLRILKGISLNYEGVDFSFDIEAAEGEADSGNFADDLLLLMKQVGELAKAKNKPVCLLIDEIQNLNKTDLAALLGAIHRLIQDNLPIMVVCAGLPNILALASEAKSYAERFTFFKIDRLNKEDAEKAILAPLSESNVSIDKEGLNRIIEVTHGYPYFLQVFAKNAWDMATSSPIETETVERAIATSISFIDETFFEVRYSRCTDEERKFLLCMAQNNVNEKPVDTKLIAACLEKSPQHVGQYRNRLIAKGMIYSTRFGEVDFTVPLFGNYIIDRTA